MAYIRSSKHIFVAAVATAGAAGGGPKSAGISCELPEFRAASDAWATPGRCRYGGAQLTDRGNIAKQAGLALVELGGKGERLQAGSDGNRCISRQRKGEFGGLLAANCWRRAAGQEDVRPQRPGGRRLGNILGLGKSVAMIVRRPVERHEGLPRPQVK